MTAAVSLQIRQEVLKEENVNPVDKLINIARGVLCCGMVVRALTRWALVLQVQMWFGPFF